MDASGEVLTAATAAAATSLVTDTNGDYLDYQDLTLPLEPKLIFEAPPQYFQAIFYVKRQHELLDAAIHSWIRKARECQSESLNDPQIHILRLTQGSIRGADGSILEAAITRVRDNKWTHQQRLMQALFSIGPDLQTCPAEALPTLLEYLGPMVLDPIEECCRTIQKTIKTAKLHRRQAMKIFENAIEKYHSTPGKQRTDGAGESHVAHSVFDSKKKLCKAIYALSVTLNHAMALQEAFIIEKTDIFLKAFNTWRAMETNDIATLKAVFERPRAETSRFSELRFPPIQFPQDAYKEYFARLCLSLMLPVSYRDLECLDPLVPTPGHKAGYLFHRNRDGSWSREYFYILPKGMLMQFAKGKDIHIANLRQTLLRSIKLDSRDFVFEICSIEVYLMESILQATTKVEFEEWKAALFYWRPPDDDILRFDKLKLNTSPTPMSPRTRHTSLGQNSDHGMSSPKPRVSVDFPVVIKGDLFVLDLRSKPMNAQNKIGRWKRINCCIHSNGHFTQYNIGENDKPFETIPLRETFRTHIWPLDSSLFSKKHCFSIKAPHDVNYYTVSIKRSSTDQKTFNAWLYALKSYAKPETFGVSRWLEYRLYRTFWIMVNDGRRLPKDLEAYCEIMLDDQRRARTSTRAKVSKGLDADTSSWRDSFEFNDLAAFSKGITINVIQAKGSKLIPFGRTYIPLRTSDECDEGWYPITHINNRTKSMEHLGDLRLKLQYEEQVILPIDNYTDLLEIIVNFQENNVLSKLAERVTDLEGFARNVMRILEGRGLAVAWINSLVDEEIAETGPLGVNTLFRANTLLTKALEAYMRLVGTEYLDDTLGDILRDICKNKVACEVDPDKLERNDDIRTQRRILMTHTRACWRAVIESVDKFPKELLLVFSHLQQRLIEKFSYRGPTGEVGPEFKSVSLVRYTGVSGFVFLRLICPAILGPRLFYIVREHPEARAHRTLTLIAKSLQGLANLVNFGAKELWMVPMNDFIIENTQSFKDFIDIICMAEGTFGNRSCSNSVYSLSIQPPHSPGSTHSIIPRAYTKDGCAAMTAGSTVTMAPSPSPSPQTRSSARHNSKEAKETVSSPVGTIDPTTMERNEDMPLLPHLIDLGKELAHFTTIVTRIIPQPPKNYEGEYEREDFDRLHENDENNLLGNEDSILRNVGRVCWEIADTTQERVQLSLDLERAERQRANETSADGKYVKGKVSREGSRDGEESYVVYEHDDGHENDIESFDGCGRGYDSDDESIEQRFTS